MERVEKSSAGGEGAGMGEGEGEEEDEEMTSEGGGERAAGDWRRRVFSLSGMI